MSLNKLPGPAEGLRGRVHTERDKCHANEQVLPLDKHCHRSRRGELAATSSDLGAASLLLQPELLAPFTGQDSTQSVNAVLFFFSRLY